MLWIILSFFLIFGNLDASVIRQKRQLSTRPIWPNATYLFHFDEVFPEWRKKLVWEVMDFISSVTCVKFQESYEEVVRIISQNGTRCASPVAYGGGIVNLKPGKFCDNAINHELLHSLGIQHEQERSDTAVYLNVKKENQLFLNNSEISIIAPFDFGSAMLYAGTENLKPYDMDYYYTMGTLPLSFFDIYNVNKLYSCTCAEELKCENFGYTNPSSCDKCICPDGFFGKLCNELKKEPIQPTHSWQTLSKTVENETLYEYIALPHQNATLEIFVAEFDENPLGGCHGGSVEIKYLPDPRFTSPKVCSHDGGRYLKVRASSNNPTVIVYHEGNKPLNYEIKYRYV